MRETSEPGSEMTESTTLLEPIRRSERIAAIDILRGLALFGIIAANIRGFSGPAALYFEPQPMWPGLGDRLAQAFIDTFVQGKFIAIFSFLFGVGFGVQLTRAEERGGPFVAVYTRRLLGLFFIGLVHGLLIWWGDILVPYAITGFLLMFFRKKNNTTIISWAIPLYLFPTILIVFAVMVSVLTGDPVPGEPIPTTEEMQEIVSIYGGGAWTEIQAQRTYDAIKYNWGYVLLIVPSLLGLFLLGLLAWRKRIFEPSPESLPVYRRVMVWGFAIGITGNLIATSIRWVSPEPLFPPSAAMLPVYLIQAVANPALSAGYVALVIVLCQKVRWQKRLAGGAAIGRTALSNYVLQSILGTLIFYSYGLGLFGIGPAMLLIPTVLIFAFEWWASKWWTARWRFGPLEWAWRSVTYGRIQPMKRRPGSPGMRESGSTE
ncbi:MAG: DUF418 domain-containing protein [Thermoanaerobaculia bacterium]|nr:DUF418 domain-containing protein [Thermoanaerobaculia bacterium]